MTVENSPEAPSPEVTPDPSKLTQKRAARQASASRRVWLAALLVGLLVGAVAYVAIPNSGGADFELRGDRELADSVVHALDGRDRLAQSMVVTRQSGDGEAEVVSGGTTDGGTEPDVDTPFETGSIFKIFTGMTLADMVENGETDLDRTLGEVFPELEFADPAVAEVTLQELATHTSGLAEIPAEAIAGATYRSSTALDAFRHLPDPVRSLETTRLVEPGEWVYSNYGFAVLGEALARESGQDYPELVRERVLDPVGMDDTVMLGTDVDTMPEGGAPPRVERGAPATTWSASTYVAAGAGTWTTAADMARFLNAVRDGSAPGLSSLDQAWQGDGDLDFGHGLGWWIIPTSDGDDVVGHGGTTNGSMAFMGYRGDTAVVALSNTMLVDMAPFAAAALGVDDVPPALQGLPTNQPSLVVQTLLMMVVPALLAITLMLRRRTLIGQRPLDRLRIISMPLGALAMMLLALRLGSLALVGPVVWALCLAVVVAALVVGIGLWPYTPTVRARFRWLRLTCFGLSVMVSLVIGVAMAWALGAAYLS
ncbi:beta-lactamase family protein [Spiractinospora alimapuensis]|uniref:serine hydrolase domain-containing protein n=1 Tax=Spiractinospora alimapuensis TaxID=2820884 RepID=UPI001F326BFE|nr:serine hydrolase domain-containing protein [Spiractinospora alimapuensis]QVQ53184.1 beta-lactamase family protein [Spiractinospora alimapuensis]